MIKKRALIFAYFWVFLGLISVYYALTYGFYNDKTPQAGFFPAVAGGILIILGVINVVNLYRNRSETAAKKENRSRVILITLAIGLYVALINIVGFIIITPITIFSILRIIQARSIFYLSFVTITATVLLYLIFHTFLKIQFPRGILF